MMSEGTKTRDGEALSNALQLLGTNVSVERRRRERVDWLPSRRRPSSRRRSTSSPTCCSTRRSPPTRSSGLRGAAARRADAGEGAAGRDRRTRVSAGALRRRASVWAVRRPRSRCKAITRDDVVAFHKAYFQPGRALITVVGDVERGRACKATIEKALAGWAEGGEKPTFAYPARAGAEERRRSIWSTSRARRSRRSRSAIPVRRATRRTTTRCR